MAYKLIQLQIEPVCEHILAQKNERTHLQRMKILLAGVSGISGQKECGEDLILSLKSCQLESRVPRIADRESPVCLLGMYVINYRTFLSEGCWGMLRNLNCRIVGKTCWVNVHVTCSNSW